MNEFEFNITIVGTGVDVDSAFQQALDMLAENPFDIIKGEVVYVNMATAEAEIKEDELEN